ncbi:MAG TPA: linear amide C-N hydrolase, partial [Pseudodesulfovibrio sp.]|nr:linear amide C-N hydrolase [Pseudodesulfovibrio sp.]
MHNLTLLGTLAGLIIFAVVSAYPYKASACSRATYLGPENIVITTRSNDWKGSQHSNIWIYPKGLKRDGNAGADSMQWTSKYGSVTVAGWDVTTIDGMNEAGLVANVLYLAESDYGTPIPGKKALSLSAWGQYALDNFATTEEAVEAMRKSP